MAVLGTSIVLPAGPASAHADSMTANARDTSASPPNGLVCTSLTSSTVGAIACYQPLGDKFWLLDTAGDGHHVAVAFSTTANHIGSCHNYHGAKAGWTICDQFADHILEHDTIYFQAMKMEGSTVLAQSDMKRDSTT